MIEQVLFLDIFSEKDPHLQAVEYEHMRFSLFYWKIYRMGTEQYYRNLKYLNETAYKNM